MQYTSIQDIANKAIQAKHISLTTIEHYIVGKDVIIHYQLTLSYPDYEISAPFAILITTSRVLGDDSTAQLLIDAISEAEAFTHYSLPNLKKTNVIVTSNEQVVVAQLSQVIKEPFESFMGFKASRLRGQRRELAEAVFDVIGDTELSNMVQDEAIRILESGAQADIHISKPFCVTKIYREPLSF